MVPHSLQTVAYALIVLIAVGFLLIIGKTFLMPIALAILFSFLLFPITNWLEQHKVARILANIIALVCTVIVIIENYFCITAHKRSRFFFTSSSKRSCPEAGMIEFILVY